MLLLAGCTTSADAFVEATETDLETSADAATLVVWFEPEATSAMIDEARAIASGDPTVEGGWFVSSELAAIEYTNLFGNDSPQPLPASLRLVLTTNSEELATKLRLLPGVKQSELKSRIGGS